MVDFKTIANKQIGGPKYPEKKRINLYQRKIKKGTIALQLLLFALFWVFLYLFVLFGVKQPMMEAERAEMIYAQMEKQLEALKSSNSIMGEVMEEYAHYGNAYQNDKERQTPDRMHMLETLKERAFPPCQSISSVSITEDHMDIVCVLPRGIVLSDLVRQIEEDEGVRYVTVTVTSTPRDMNGEQLQVLAEEKNADAVLTVYFKVPGEESGEES